MKKIFNYILCGIGLCLAQYSLAQGGSGVVTTFHHDNIGGTIRCDRVSGNTFRMEASHNPGYEFFSWSDGVTTNPRDYTHPSDVTKDFLFRAVFVKSEDLVQKGGTSSVQIADPQIPSYTLKATANTNAEFKFWNNGVTSNTITYLESDGTRIPFFELNEGTVSVFTHDNPGGKVRATLVSGVTYQVQATANTGYAFQSWIDGNTANPRTYTHVKDVAEDSLFRAVFVKQADVILPGGTVTVVIDNPSVPSYLLTQHAESCATFHKWVNGGENNTKSYLETDGTIFPIYTFGEHDLTAEAHNNEGGYIQCDTIPCGYILRAIPNDGFYFYKWEDESTNPVRNVNHVAALYRATFTDVLNVTINSGGLPSDFQEGALAQVTLQRPLSSASFNTICLPFDMAVSEFGTNCEVYEMTSQSPSIVDGELTISFTQAVSNLEAGKPYLIKPQTDISSDLVLSQFKVLNSQLTPIVSQYVDFVPVLEPTLLQADNNILFVGQGNLLYHPVAMGNIQGLRGYFRLHDIPSNVPTRLTFTKNVVTNSPDVLNTNLCPTKFIQNGQLLMRVHGAIYNSIGMTIK